MVVGHHQKSPGLRACRRESAPAAASSARRNPAVAPRPAGSMLVASIKIKKPSDRLDDALPNHVTLFDLAVHPRLQATTDHLPASGLKTLRWHWLF